MSGKSMYDKWREKYKPEPPLKIKCLLIAESPPQQKSGEEPRFFYYSDNEKYDFMFKSIMEVVFGEFKDNYKKGEKNNYLKKFRDCGYYMIDAVDDAVNQLSESKRNKKIEENMDNKIEEIDKLLNNDSKKKKNIFNLFHDVLI